MPDADPDRDATVLPVLREELAVHAQREPAGAVRVRVVPRVHEVDRAVSTVHETVEVERRPVGRTVDAPVAPWHDGEVLVVPVYAERLVVARELVLVEELRLHRRREAHAQTVTLALRRDEVVLERRDGAGTWRAVPAGAPDARDGPAGDGRSTAAASSDASSKRTPMRQTVVGVFDRFSAAQHAAELLRQRGIADDFIQITESQLEEDDDKGATTGRPAGLLDRIKSFFSGTSDDDFELSAYSEAVRRGGGVVKVEVDEEPEAETAREVLTEAGAVDIDERVSEWKASGWTPEGAGGTASAASAPTASRAEGEQVIPVVREELAVGKRVVKAGGVRVYARTVAEPVHETVQLREERARVERRPVDRPASGADLEALGERRIEVEESVERPVVEKTARVVEEVVVGKDVRQKTADVSETVRRTEVEVSEFGGEELEPARSYGRTLATDARYQGRDWDSFESDARSAWTRDHPESAWERVKDTVREAWRDATR